MSPIEEKFRPNTWSTAPECGRDSSASGPASAAATAIAGALEAIDERRPFVDLAARLRAVLVEPGLTRTFYGRLKPVSDKWVPEALAVSGFSREETLKFEEPAKVMRRFDGWVRENSRGRPMFIADNNGFDWQFINWYFHHFLGRNPFGFSSTNLGSLYKRQNNFERAMEEYLPPPPTGLLDCGGGPGRYAIELTRRGYQVTLFDLSADPMESRNRFADPEYREVLERLAADGRDLTPPEGA